MKLNRLTRTLLAAGMLLAALPGQAETINLQQAVEMSLTADPRIKEREQLVEVARGMLQEVQGNFGWRASANAFIGLAPAVEGGFYQGGAYSGTVPRTDGNSISEVDDLSDWTHLSFSLIKPLYTFGKIERYGEAAQGQVDLKRGELSIQATVLTENEGQKLRAAAGSAAFRIEHTFYDFQEEPVSWGWFIVPACHLEFDATHAPRHRGRDDVHVPHPRLALVAHAHCQWSAVHGNAVDWHGSRPEQPGEHQCQGQRQRSPEHQSLEGGGHRPTPGS